MKFNNAEVTGRWMLGTPPMCLLLKPSQFLSGTENIVRCLCVLDQVSYLTMANPHKTEFLSVHIREPEDKVKIVLGQSFDPGFDARWR